MGVSTDGKISYGVAFEEGFEFPWVKTEQDIDDWWEEVVGFKPSVQPWDAQGNRRGSEAQYEQNCTTYFKEKREWAQAFPLPVTLVNYCSDSCSMYILAVAGSVRTANRGSVEDVLPMSPRWLLSAYWG